MPNALDSVKYNEPIDRSNQTEVAKIRKKVGLRDRKFCWRRS
jgi:hypothetical protein